MNEKFFETVEIPFKLRGESQQKCSVNFNTMNYGPKSKTVISGKYSYYDCNEFRNAWYSKHNRRNELKGYHNFSSYMGDYQNLSVDELRKIAFLRGRELARLILFEGVLDDEECVVLIYPKNSLGEGFDKETVRNNSSRHIASWIGFGVRAYLKIEGRIVIPIRFNELCNPNHDDVKKITKSARFIVVEDTILSGKSMYELIEIVVNFMIKLDVNQFEFEVCSFFIRTDGLQYIKGKNGWVRYGFSGGNISEVPRVKTSMRVPDEFYSRYLRENVPKGDWTESEKLLVAKHE